MGSAGSGIGSEFSGTVGSSPGRVGDCNSSGIAVAWEDSKPVEGEAAGRTAPRLHARITKEKRKTRYPIVLMCIMFPFFRRVS
jgi:hypothetical protein